MLWAANFGLIAGIEAVLDIAQYVLADKGIKTESYNQIPNQLFEAKIIDEKFKDKLRKILGFRNRTIHNYPSLDVKKLNEILHNDIDDFKEFLKVIQKVK